VARTITYTEEYTVEPLGSLTPIPVEDLSVETLDELWDAFDAPPPADDDTDSNA